MNSTDDMLDFARDVREQLTTRLNTEPLSLLDTNHLRSITEQMSRAIGRLQMLGARESAGVVDTDWGVPELVTQTKKLTSLARGLQTVENERLNELASEMASILDFVVAHVEPDKPWPRK